MKDRKGNTAHVGDYVAIAARAGNIAEFKFGWLSELDEEHQKFKMIHEDTDKESSWFNWYYHEIPANKYCKVLILKT